MKRYYFDLRIANTMRIDAEGYEYPDLAAVQWAALLALVDVSRETDDECSVLQSDVTIEVRDNAGPVMEVAFRHQPRRAN